MRGGAVGEDAEEVPVFVAVVTCGAACRCRTKYYNNVLFHSVQKDFIVQTGDPTGTGKGGESIYG